MARKLRKDDGHLLCAKGHDGKDVGEPFQLRARKINLHRSPIRSTVLREINIVRRVDDVVLLVSERGLIDHVTWDFGYGPRVAAISRQQELAASPTCKNRIARSGSRA